MPIAILAAAIAGLAALLVQSGLPRLYHTVFDLPEFERVSQDSFLLALDAPTTENDMERARDWLTHSGAVAIWEVKP